METTTVKLIWLKFFVASLEVFHQQPIRLYFDNQDALHMAANPVFHVRTEHIEVDRHYVHEQLMEINIATTYVGRRFQLADIFTKVLG